MFRLYTHIAYCLPFESIFLLGATSLCKMKNGLGKMLIHVMEFPPKCNETGNDYTINTRQDETRQDKNVPEKIDGSTTKQVDIL